MFGVDYTDFHRDRLNFPNFRRMQREATREGPPSQTWGGSSGPSLVAGPAARRWSGGGLALAGDFCCLGAAEVWGEGELDQVGEE
jgi:hypothetical protein